MRYSSGNLYSSSGRATRLLWCSRHDYSLDYNGRQYREDQLIDFRVTEAGRGKLAARGIEEWEVPEVFHNGFRRLRNKGNRAASHRWGRSEEHTSELQSHLNLVCRLLL